MAIFAKKLTPEWREAFQKYEKISGFEFMHQDDIDAGEMTPREAWERNIRWLEDVVADCTSISTPIDEDKEKSDE